MGALGINQYRNPAVQKALQAEVEQLKTILAEAHPKGLTVKDMSKKFHKQQGYLLQPHTVKARVEVMIENDEAHVSIQKGKYGAKLYILGPDPKPMGAESQPETEPPLASDELLSLVYHMEGVLTAKIEAIDRKVNLLLKEWGLELPSDSANPNKKENNNAKY